MILSQNSILHFLPINLEKRQFLFLDSIRFSLEIIDNSWLSLINQIELLSSQEFDSIKDLPRLYIEVWSIIDNVQRFIKLHSRLNIESQENITSPINFIKDFRHTYQHLEERADQALIENDVPIYGILTWNYSNPSTEKIEVFIASSGITRYPSEFKYDVTNFDEFKVVDNIKLDTIVRIKLKEEIVFDRTQLDLSTLVNKLKSVVNAMEIDLETQFQSLNLKRADWMSRKDILIRIKN